ncbi:hypothetical protein LTR12_010443 [Friedmanniomyces endolithicus]|nr:hypothetical protein LTR12_010443 [Friedmanniomyces endolithicus]
MESTEEGLLGASLLQWVDSFEVPGKSERREGLSDGQTLWRIVQEVDSEYFAGKLPEPDVEASGDWTRKWQNLKHVERQISTYYRDVCNGQDGLAADSVPDLKAIAASNSRRDLERLIMIIIRAAMASPESNERMAHKLMGLGRERAMVIANELRGMEEPEDGESEPASRDESAYQSEQENPAKQTEPNGNKGRHVSYHDPMLEREEELLQAQATIDKLQASYGAAQRQLQELRQDKELLQEAFDEYRADIDGKGNKAGNDDEFRKLQRQTDNDRAYIEDLEAQMQSSRTTIESYESQAERLKLDGEASQKLRDDMQILKADNEELNQKLRANENLKKKIQALQEHERANVTLKEELKSAHERSANFDQLRQLQAGLEKEIIEKKGLIRNQEYQINELITTRKHAEHDARVLAQKLEAARERNDRDHEALEELRLKLQDTTVGVGETPMEQDKRLDDGVERRTLEQDESKHLAEKLLMLEQQLETADARLRQTSERNAALEEEKRISATDSEAQRKNEQQVSSEHEATIAELRQQLEGKSKQEQQPRPTERGSAEDLAALQRENRLMSTAWYELSSRLQYSGVSLAKRRYEPKSWIGKQRLWLARGRECRGSSHLLENTIPGLQ